MRRERVNCSLTLDEIEPNVLIIKPFYLQTSNQIAYMNLSFLEYTL